MIQSKIIDLYCDLLKEYHTLMVGKIRRGSRGPETAKKLLFLDIQCDKMKDDFLEAAKNIIEPPKKLDKKGGVRKNKNHTQKPLNSGVKH